MYNSVVILKLISLIQYITQPNHQIKSYMRLEVYIKLVFITKDLEIYTVCLYFYNIVQSNAMIDLTFKMSDLVKTDSAKTEREQKCTHNKTLFPYVKAITPWNSNIQTVVNPSAYSNVHPLEYLWSCLMTSWAKRLLQAELGIETPLPGL